MYLYGSVIAVSMHFSSVAPRACWDAGAAQAAFSVLRLGPTVPVVPAAASVWQDPQPPTPVKICLPTAGVGLHLHRHRRRERAGVLARPRRHRRNVGGNVLGILALHEHRRHHALGVRVLDPVRDEPLDRGALHPVDPVLPERIVEVRTRRSRWCWHGRACGTSAQFVGEQLLAGHEIGSGMLDRTTTQRDRDYGCRHERSNASQRLDHTLRRGTLSKPSAGAAAGRAPEPSHGATGRESGRPGRAASIRPLLYDDRE